MTVAFVAVLWLVLTPIAICAGYVAMLSVLALLPSVRPRARQRRPARSFLILIPAHNEESLLGRTLESVRRLKYPASQLRTVVIADNCDDRTAEVARLHGAVVVERHERDRFGKGYAVAYGLAHVRGDFDAVVFLDADCTVSPNLLLEFSAWLDTGARAVQARYNIRTDGQSTLLLRSLALTLMHTVRGRGKAHLGWSAGLKGSGMCFDRALVAERGWTKHGLAEDAEQHVELLLADIRVAYADEATVLGLSPLDLGSATTQHARWEAGRLAVARSASAKLLRVGMDRRSPGLVAEALELSMPPLSVIGLLLAGVSFCAWMVGSTGLLVFAALSAIWLAMYVSAGFVLMRMGVGAAVRCLISIPRFALWKSMIFLRALVKSPRRWEPTRPSSRS